MATKKIWPDGHGCDELSKHADPGVLRDCFHFYSVHCCSFLFFVHACLYFMVGSAQWHLEAMVNGCDST